jgi:hypothetical protein
LKETSLPSYPVILCFVTGPQLPDYSIAMSRLPAPPLGAVFDEAFSGFYLKQLNIIPALHDGAVIFSRKSAVEDYRLSGWSHRLLSPFSSSCSEPNRGSAYNSAISMSLVSSVDCVALISESEVEVYLNGNKIALDMRD